MKKIVSLFLFMFMILFNGVSAPKGNRMEALKNKKGLFAVINTTKGDIAVELYYKDAPLTVLNFVGLAEGKLDAANGKKFYDGLTFHRVIENFMIQGGDPRGNGTGGPGYKFADEFTDKYKFDNPGYLAMANSGANTNGSQFFITHVPTEWLNNKHTIFGHVVSDEDQKVVNAVMQGDKINSITIVRNGTDADNFEVSQGKFNELSEKANKIMLAKKEALMADKIKEVEKKFPGYKKNVDGIYYKITKNGSGNTVGKGVNVSVDYKGYLVDGKVFDTSKGREPLSFRTASGQMIPGFDVMVQDMKLGESRTIILPPDLAYGEQGYPGVIPPNSYLVFDLSLVKIQ